MVGQKLVQKSSQSLVMSKQMQHSLKILQMNSDELTANLQSELEKNPFLEVDFDLDSLNKKSENTDDQNAAEMWQSESYLRYDKASKSNVYGSNSHDIDSIQDERKSLITHVLEQIQILFSCKKQILIAQTIADNLDGYGYFRRDPEFISQQLKCSESDVELVLDKLKTIEPTGLFAKDLHECLIMQANERFAQDTTLVKALDYLDDIAAFNLKKVCKKLNIKSENIHDVLNKIKLLDPKPAEKFNTDIVRIKVPEAFIVKNPKGQLQAVLNMDSIPKAYVNHKQYNHTVSTSQKVEDKKYCKAHYNSANWLVKSIAQRAETILKVTQKIAHAQEDFFTYGINFLKPMTLSDLSKDIGLHESTLSRVSNKFIQTPMGIFELKFFFSNSLSSNISENIISTKVVKNKIKEIINLEHANGNIMSDTQIAEYLVDNGINISRRTVAKYRDIMKIEPSHIRKRKFNIK